MTPPPAAVAVEILRVDRLPSTPWKNRLGTTRAIAAAPPGADFDSADWRVDLSDIRGPADFSRLPGIDRLLMPLATGLRLGFEGAPPAAVEIFQPLAFDGAAQAACDVAPEAAGGLSVVNLLLRRGRHTGRLAAFPGSGRLHAPGGAVVLYAARGNFTLVLDGGAPLRLDTGHAAVYRDATAPLAFDPARPWSLLVAATIDAAG